MSDRTSERTCAAVRNQMLSLLAGDVSALEQARLRGHLLRCDSCHLLFDETSEMMTTGREQRYLPSATAKEALFQRVMDRLEVEETPRVQRSSRRIFAWAASAAAAIAIAGLGYTLFGRLPATDGPHQASPRAAQSRQESASAAELPALIAEAVGPSLFVGKTAATRYAADRQGDAERLTVTAGTLWIRFQPSETIRTLTVVGPNVTVRVTGTVLMLRADSNGADTVGVLRGHVRATPNGAKEIRLGEGESLTVGKGDIAQLPAAQKEQAALWLAKLVDEVASRTCTDPEPDESGEPEAAPAAATKDAPPASATLYSEAEQLMARGEWAAAARRLERLVSQNPKSARADTARLDLSRIYAGRLGQPRRAAKHLQTYLTRHPDSAEAALLHRRLCTLLPKEDGDRPENCPN